MLFCRFRVVPVALMMKLARSQLRAPIRELLTRVPKIEVGEPEFALGDLIRVVNHLAVHRE
jgi:hypothetical protein